MVAGAALGDELHSAAAAGPGRVAPRGGRFAAPPAAPPATEHHSAPLRDAYPAYDGAYAALEAARGAVLDATREGTVYIGRQAVLDASGRVMGYELLYRRRGDDRALVRDHLDATRTVVSAAMVEFGLEHIVRDGIAFVNVTRDFLAAGLHRTLPAERVILEVLEDEAVDDHLIELLGGVRAEGYRLALDDYTPGSAHRRLLGLVDTVKIDMLATPRAALAALVDELRSRQVTVLAEKVETYA